MEADGSSTSRLSNLGVGANSWGFSLYNLPNLKDQCFFIICLNLSTSSVIGIIIDDKDGENSLAMVTKYAIVLS